MRVTLVRYLHAPTHRSFAPWRSGVSDRRSFSRGVTHVYDTDCAFAASLGFTGDAGRCAPVDCDRSRSCDTTVMLNKRSLLKATVAVLLVLLLYAGPFQWCCRDGQDQTPQPRSHDQLQRHQRLSAKNDGLSSSKLLSSATSSHSINRIREQFDKDSNHHLSGAMGTGSPSSVTDEAMRGAGSPNSVTDEAVRGAVGVDQHTKGVATRSVFQHKLATPSRESSLKKTWPKKPSRKCHEKVCIDAIGSGRKALLACLRAETSQTVPSNLPLTHECSCTLQDGKDPSSKLVALVSLPGSGNTWVRGLLEKATGICTGSMWCDPSLKLGGFCGEGLRNKSTIVVKVHNPAIRWVREKLNPWEKMKPIDELRFDAAIVVHRDPYAATVAERNRAAAFKYGSRYDISSHGNTHMSYSGKEMFGDNPEWWELIHSQMERWRLEIERLVMNRARHPILVVRYEDLKRDEAGEVKRMVEFLGVPYSQEKAGEGFTNYYRNHTDTFDHFTPEQKQFVNEVILQVIEEMKQKNIADELQLEQYIRN